MNTKVSTGCVRPRSETAAAAEKRIAPPADRRAVSETRTGTSCTLVSLLGKLCTGGRAEADGWRSHVEDFGEPGVGRRLAASEFRGAGHGPTLYPGLIGRTAPAAAAAGGGPGRGSLVQRG